MCHCARSAVFFLFSRSSSNWKKKKFRIGFYLFIIIFLTRGWKEEEEKSGSKKKKKEQNICAVSCFCAPCDSVKMKKKLNKCPPSSSSYPHSKEED